MHELGTIYYVIDTVEKLAAENDLKKVASITLEVGTVSGNGAEDRTYPCRHLLSGLQEHLSYHSAGQDLSSLRQRKHFPCHRE